MKTRSEETEWGDLDHPMAETFIHKVFEILYGDEYEYEGWSYDNALQKIKNLVQQVEGIQ